MTKNKRPDPSIPSTSEKEHHPSSDDALNKFEMKKESDTPKNKRDDPYLRTSHPSENNSPEDSGYKPNKGIAAGLVPANLEESKKEYQRDESKFFNQKNKVEEYIIEKGNYSARDLEIPRELYAGFWIRVSAYTVDIIFIFLINQIIFGLINYFTGNLDFAASLWANLLRLLLYCSYFALNTYWFNGQSPGKMLFNLRVISIDEENLSAQTVLIREFFGRIIFFYAAWIMVLLIFSDKKQHLIDLLTDTAVIQEKYLTAFIKWQSV